jgi:hypothetical protein
LLKEYLAWVPPALQPAIETIWPPVEYTQEYEIHPDASKGIPPVREKKDISKKLQVWIDSINSDQSLKLNSFESYESDGDSE